MKIQARGPGRLSGRRATISAFVAGGNVTGERWRLIEDLFTQALERPASDRQAFLEDAFTGEARMVPVDEIEPVPPDEPPPLRGV